MELKGLADTEWKLLSEVIEARFGLTFDGARREILASRLATRVKALRLGSYLEYYHYLKYHPAGEAELELLPRTLTNNETYFFREPHHFDLIVRHIVPALHGRPLRVLSAGCSSGEEPYSLAIALHEGAGKPAGRWEIDACDLNPERLDQARAASYGAAALRSCSEDTRLRYFEPDGERFVLKASYRAGVRFFRFNLADPAAMLPPAQYDAVLCRNVLIYFSDEGYRALVRRLAAALRPGGYLLLGHSESLFDCDVPVRPVVRDGVVVYQYPEAA